MNTDKLPKAEDVLKLELNIDRLTPLQYSGVIRAMHEYTRQVLDVVADNATTKLCQELQIKIVDRESILSFKDKLK